MANEVFDVKAFGEDPLWGAFRERLFSEQSELPSTTVAPNLEALQKELETVCEQLLQKLNVRKSDHDALCMASQTSPPDRRLLSIALLKEKLLSIKAKLNKNSLVLLLKFKQQLERIFQVLGKEDAWGPPTVTIASTVSSGAGGRRPFIKRANPGGLDAALFDFSAGGAGWGIYQLELALIQVAALKFFEARLLTDEDFTRVQSEISELQGKLQANYDPQEMIKGIQKLGFELENAAQGPLDLVKQKLAALDYDIFKPYEKLPSYPFFLEDLTKAKRAIEDFFSRFDSVVKPHYYFACQMLPLIHQDISVRHLVLFELNTQSKLIEYMQSKLEHYPLLGVDLRVLLTESHGLFQKYCNVDDLTTEQMEELASFSAKLNQSYEDLRCRAQALGAQAENERRLEKLERQYQDLLKKQPQPEWNFFPIFDEFQIFLAQSRQALGSAEAFLRSCENFEVCFELMSQFFNGLDDLKHVELLFGVNRPVSENDAIINLLRVSSRLFRMAVKSLHYSQYFDDDGRVVSVPIRDKSKCPSYYTCFYLEDGEKKLPVHEPLTVPLFSRSSENMHQIMQGARQQEQIRQDLQDLQQAINVREIILKTIHGRHVQGRQLREIQPHFYQHIVLPFLNDEIAIEHPAFSQHPDYFKAVFQREPKLSYRLKVMMFRVFYQVCEGQNNLDTLITEAEQLVRYRNEPPPGEPEALLFTMQCLMNHYAQQSGRALASDFILKPPHPLEESYGRVGQLGQRISNLQAGAFASYPQDLQREINILQYQVNGLTLMLQFASRDPNPKVDTLRALLSTSETQCEKLEGELRLFSTGALAGPST